MRAVQSRLLRDRDKGELVVASFNNLVYLHKYPPISDRGYRETLPPLDIFLFTRKAERPSLIEFCNSVTSLLWE